jgi:signal transduction histidine kinase
MQIENDEKELKSLLRRLLYRGLLILGLLLLLGMGLSLVLRGHLQGKLAAQLSQAVRNDLLLGNNAEVLKVLKPTVASDFLEVSYLDGARILFLIKSPNEANFFQMASLSWHSICLEATTPCSTFLVFRYSLLSYLPYVLSVGAVLALVLFLVNSIFRKHVVAYYREQLKSHKEAALGRLSSRICHDLKLPGMIFQRLSYLDDPVQFMELRPQLQIHIRRLYAMIEKLKNAELEGLLQPRAHTLVAEELKSFLATIAPTPDRLRFAMESQLRVFLDIEKLERSLANLVLNAFEAGATEVSVQLQKSETDLLARVENNGPAMPPAVVLALKSPGKSSGLQGLGLRIVRDTVLAHGGRLDLTSDEKGTQFLLFFPDACPDVLEDLPQADEVQPISPAAKSDGVRIWTDAALLHRAELCAPDQSSTVFTAAPDALMLAHLVVSVDPLAIESALSHGIPVIVVNASSDEQIWMRTLASRLRLLRLSMNADANARSSGQQATVERRER